MSISVALVGYGYAGKTFHAPLIRSTPGLELAAVVSRRPEGVRADFPDVLVVSDLQSVPADVSLVVIATPNATHASLATAVLRAGKHVVVDKPFVLTVDDAKNVAHLAESRQLLLSVFQNRRWDSDFLGAKAVIAAGLLGDIVHFESHFDRFRPEVRERWREQDVPGGGLLFDLGPHLADQALQLFGFPDSVSAFTASQRMGARVDDWLHMVLEYGRLRVILHASVLAAGGVRRLVMHGTKGSWIKASPDVQEEQLRRGLAPGAAGWGIDPEPATFFDGSSACEVAVPAGDYRHYYAEIRDAILGTGRNPVTPVQAIDVTALLELAAQSAREGRRLACDP
jgi:predicted dehydrogenase